MATLRAAESAAFTQVMEVTQTEVERGWMDRGEGEEEEVERKSGGSSLDSPPHRHADLNGG